MRKNKVNPVNTKPDRDSTLPDKKSEKKPDEPIYFGPGRQLALAREKRGLELEKVASELHLSVATLRFLEADDYKRLPPTSYVRGYFRSYAEFLGMKSEPLIILFNQSVGAEDTTQKIRPAIAGEKPPLKGHSYFGILLLIGIALATVYSFKDQWLDILAEKKAEVLPLLSQDSANPESSAVNAGQDLVVTNAPEPPPAVIMPEPALIEMQPPAQPDVAAPTTPDVDADAVQPEEESTVPAADSLQPALVIHLTGDSWMDIRDGDGNKLLYGSKKAGAQHQASGKLPIQGTVGNYKEVQIEYNGQPVKLTPYGTTGVAKLSILPEDDGAVLPETKSDPASPKPAVPESFE